MEISIKFLLERLSGTGYHLSIMLIYIIFSVLPSCSEPKSSSPNILFAIADDWSCGHSSLDVYQQVNTPAFDRIAAEGIYFHRAYCSAPSCAPSRAAILAGKNGWELEQGGMLWGYIPRRFPLYTDLLEAAGYFIGYTGKGYGPGSVKASGRTENPAGRAYNKLRKEPLPEITNGKSEINHTDYAANFKAFLEDKPEGTPFCFWFGATEPHRKYNAGIGRRSGKDPQSIHVPGFLPDDPVIREDIADYLVEVEWFDNHMQSILEILEERGELQNTLIVMTSDNGMPFPRAKANLYEYGTHMPLAIMWKGKIRGGREVFDFVNFIDFAPTFLEAAGIDIPATMTGKSLMPLLLSHSSGQIDPNRDRAFTFRERHSWCYPKGEIYPMRAIRKNNWLLIWNMKSFMWPAGRIEPEYNWCHESFGDVDPSPSKTRITELAEKGDSGWYDLAFGKRPEFELYDVEKDLYQTTNLSAGEKYQGVFDELKNELIEYLHDTHDPRIEGRDSVFSNTPYTGPPI